MPLNEGWRLPVRQLGSSGLTLFVAREDQAAAFVDGHGKLDAPRSTVVSLKEAHVCTVCSRPGHYSVLVPMLGAGSPFSGLYTFGGNPVLVELALGRYDAVFQPDAQLAGDSQDLWDWLPGVHIAWRAGCTILDLFGAPVDVVGAAERSLAQGVSDFSYVAAVNGQLADALHGWMTIASTRSLSE